MQEKSFLEILTEKIESEVKSRLHASPPPVTRFDTNEFSTFSGETLASENTLNQETPTWISQIPLGKIEFQTPKSKVFGRVYPINQPQKRPQKPAPPRKKHVLNEMQQQAMTYFLQWKLGLSEDFTRDELKKAFRLLAMKLHPDRNNGVTSLYMELKKHYDNLSLAVENT